MIAIKALQTMLPTTQALVQKFRMSQSAYAYTLTLHTVHIHT